LTKIFHPNIRQPTGEICVNTLKKDWKPSHGLRHVLMVIRCLLIEPFPESALNEDAAKLMLEDYDEYFRRARMFTEIHAKASGSQGHMLGESSASSLGFDVPTLKQAKSGKIKDKDKKRSLRRL
jgi:ubiquitin-conjugating enzyme E2 S